MSSSAKRERQLARERYERRQARRQEALSRRRKLQQILAVVVAVGLVVAGAVGLALSMDGDDENTVATQGETSAAPSPSSPAASTTAAASSPAETAPAGDGGCTFAETGDAAKDVGVPTYDKKAAAEPATATLVTSQGEIVIELATDKAPCTTTSFRHLAEQKYFDDTSCHRLTTGGIFVLQCGDPTGSGSGGPGYQFGVENAPADQTYPPGTVAMARTSDPNSNGSQFFLVYDETTLPDPTGYSVFGQITEGMDIVQKVAEQGVEGGGTDGQPTEQVRLETVRTGKA